MKIAITDANIFIDLINLKLISHFFDLNVETHTSLEVLSELFPVQQEILLAYKSAKRLIIHNLSDEELDAVQEYVNINRLSDADKTVIFIAHKIEAMVLSSDGPVRKFAKQKNIETHGLVWLFDELVSNNILAPLMACSKIDELLNTNRRYREDTRMYEELRKRVMIWQTHQ